jgi:hypothetical protein
MTNLETVCVSLVSLHSDKTTYSTIYNAIKVLVFPCSVTSTFGQNIETGGICRNNVRLYVGRPIPINLHQQKLASVRQQYFISHIKLLLL